MSGRRRTAGWRISRTGVPCSETAVQRDRLTTTQFSGHERAITSTRVPQLELRNSGVAVLVDGAIDDGVATVQLRLAHSRGLQKQEVELSLERPTFRIRMDTLDVSSIWTPRRTSCPAELRDEPIDQRRFAGAEVAGDGDLATTAGADGHARTSTEALHRRASQPTRRRKGMKAHAARTCRAQTWRRALVRWHGPCTSRNRTGLLHRRVKLA